MLDSLFRPRSVAIVGASARYYNIGYRILTNLSEHGFNGPVYPVNPKGGHIRNFKAYTSVLEIPDEVDLAHIVIKNTLVPTALKECGEKGVKAVIINTAGFKEIGGEGAELEEEILKIARRHDIRLFGPNCQGVMNSDPEVSLYANFTFTPLRPGHISVVAQSGGVGEVINNRLFELGAGVRMYASNGNACDIGIPEIMEYMGGDEGTRVIIVHIESLADPQEFMRVASAVTPRKPILAIKTGRTETGARAVASHTGTLLKSGMPIELMFKKYCVQHFTSEEELCQTAIGFAQQPLPAGPNVGLITNTGGPAIVATDECIEAGLKIPPLAEATAARLREHLYPEASVNNPIDVLATGGPEHFAAAINAMLGDEEIDSILLNFVTPFFVDCEAVAAEIARVSRDTAKPILGTIMTNKAKWAGTMKIIKESGIPAYDFPETAARVLISMTRYAQWRRDILDTRRGTAVEMRPETVREARSLVEACEKGRFMPADKAYELLAKYKVPTANWAAAANSDELLRAAEKVGFPLVLKVDAEAVVHKTDEGGVALNIREGDELAARFDEFSSRFARHNPRYLLQEYLTGGMETAMGVKKEGAMGHVLMFGLGGIFVEVLKDVSFALAPLSPADVDTMMRGIRGYALLEGVRGRQGADIAVLSQIMLKLSRLVCDIPEIQEMDLNPVIAFPQGRGAKVADVRIRL